MATDMTSVDVVAGNDIEATEMNKARADIVRRAGDYDDSTGSANAYVLAIDASINTAYLAGTVFRFQANFANTASATLNVNGLGAITIKKADGKTLAVGDILSGQEVGVIYDGTDMIVLSHMRDQRAFLTDTRDMTAATGAETVAHGLAVTPRFVRVHVHQSNAGDTRASMSDGSYDGTTNRSVWTVGIEGDSDAGVSTTFAIKVGSSTTAFQSAIITFDGTNITLTWTKTGSPDGTAYIHLEAIT